MSDTNLIPIALENYFSRQGQERSMAFQREQDARNLQAQIALSNLQAYFTSLENAKTEQDFKKTHQIFGKAVEKMTKDLPGGPIQLFTDGDIENISRIIREDPSAPINSAIAEEVAKSYAGLLSGTVSRTEVVDRMSRKISELTKQYDPTYVQKGSVTGYQGIIEAIQQQAQTKTVERQLSMAALQNMPRIDMQSPAKLYLTFLDNIDANANSETFRIAFPGKAPGQITDADWMDLGLRSLGRVPGTEKLTTEKQASLIPVGQAYYEKLLRTTKAEMNNKYLTETGPLLQKMEEQSAEDQWNFYTQQANQFLSDGRLKQLDFHSLGFDKLTQELQEKFTSGIPTTRDTENVANAVDALANSGLLDKANLGKFSKMSPEERSNAAGSIENAMRSIRRNGTSLYDLFYDKDGLVRPNLDMLTSLDLDKLANGDPVVWDLAKHLTEKGTDPTDFRTKLNGKTVGIVEAMRYSLESDPKKYSERSTFIMGGGPGMYEGVPSFVDPASRFSDAFRPLEGDDAALEEASKKLDAAILSGDPKALDSIQRTMFGDVLVDSAQRLKDMFREMVITGNYEAGLMTSPAEKAMQLYEQADKERIDYVAPLEESSPLSGNGSKTDPRSAARATIQRAATPPVTVRTPR